MQIESVLKYIPPDRRESLVRKKPLADLLTGAALFADISGFTTLTESLARALGARQGAEELTRQLNRVYDALIHETDQFGGSIISFNGDAITCWFDGDSGTHRAVTCAFALQRVMKAFDLVQLPNGESVPLAIKVAVANGSARRFLIGDSNILLMDVLGGQTLARMADAEHHAHKGEVVVDEATVDLLRGCVQIKEWRKQDQSNQRFAILAGLPLPAAPFPWQPLDYTSLNFEDVRRWALRALTNRKDESLTELRPAFALFVHFDGIDFDEDPFAGIKLDSYVRWIQGIVARYDGALLQVTVGDKGSYLYIAFGAPIAHENDALRAASAALDLIALPAEYGYIQDVQIGISQGMMRTGAYGGETRRTYSVLGDDVNLAARLMQQAPTGQIFISGAVQKALPAAFQVEELPPLHVKGKQEPIAAVRLIARVSDSLQANPYSRPLIGRSREFAELTAHLNPLHAGKAVRALWIYGEPGIGKSHLIQAACQQLTADGSVRQLNFVSDQLVQQSLHPFLPVLAKAFGFQPTGSDQDHKEQFAHGIADLLTQLRAKNTALAEATAHSLDEQRSFLGALLNLRWKSSPYENLDPKLRFDQSLAALTTWVQAQSLCKPLIVHIQDAQWLDADSQHLLANWVEATASFPIALLIDSRELHDDDLIYYGKGDAQLLQCFQVRELETSSIEELASVVLNGKIDDSVCDYLIRKANGNPFFTEQLALDLSERGLITRGEENSWVLDTNAAEDIPVTLNTVLIARLDRLMVEVRSVVQIASVLGQEFEMSVLTQMIRDDPEVPLKVKRAEEELIWIERNKIDYLFRHALLRDAAYSMQLQERLRELHALAGWAIEQVHANNLAVMSPDLAFHYEKSAIYERAVIYMIKSAQHMASLHANREAMAYYHRAIELSEKALLPPFEIAPIHEGLGDLYDLFGEYPQAVAHYDIALTYLDAERADWRATLHRKRGQVLQKWGNYEEATAAFEAGLVELQANLDPNEASQIYSGLSMINYRQGKVDDATELATLSLLMAQMQEDKRNLAYAHQILGILYWKKEEYAQALEADNESLALWQETESLLGQAAIRNNLGLLYQKTGDLAAAKSSFEQCLTLFEQVGNLHGLACAYDNLGQVQMELGNEDAAMDCLEHAVAILAKIGLNETEVFTSMWQSGTW